MTNRRLKELREKVLGNDRGREVEVDPNGQIVLDSEDSDKTAAQDQETEKPKRPKMSPNTWGI